MFKIHTLDNDKKIVISAGITYSYIVMPAEITTFVYNIVEG